MIGFDDFPDVCRICGYVACHAPDCPVLLREEQKRIAVVVFLACVGIGAVAVLVAQWAGVL